MKVYRTFASVDLEELIEDLPQRQDSPRWARLREALDLDFVAGIAFKNPETGELEEMQLWQVEPDGASPEWFLEMLEQTGLSSDPHEAWERLPWYSDVDIENYYSWKQQFERLYTDPVEPDPDTIPDGPPPYQGEAYCLDVEQDWEVRPVFRCRKYLVCWRSPQDVVLFGRLEVAQVRDQAGRRWIVAANPALKALFEQIMCNQ